jgi:hypothetical protein
MMPPSSNLRAVVNHDGAAILDIEHNSISTLNPTGSFVWQGLQRGESIAVIIANLVGETGEDPVVVGRDVKSFVLELREKHLLPR